MTRIRTRSDLLAKGRPYANRKRGEDCPMFEHIGPSKYMPHIGKKQLANSAARVG